MLLAAKFQKSQITKKFESLTQYYVLIDATALNESFF